MRVIPTHNLETLLLRKLVRIQNVSRSHLEAVPWRIVAAVGKRQQLQNFPSPARLALYAGVEP